MCQVVFAALGPLELGTSLTAKVVAHNTIGSSEEVLAPNPRVGCRVKDFGFRVEGVGCRV